MELTPRLKKLQDRLFNVEYHDPGCGTSRTRTSSPTTNIRREPLVVRKAKAIEHICLHLPAIVKADELIVGNPNQNSVGWGTVLPIYYTAEEGSEAKRYLLNESSVWGHHPPSGTGSSTRGCSASSGRSPRPSTASSARWSRTPQRSMSTGP